MRAVWIAFAAASLACGQVAAPAGGFEAMETAARRAYEANRLDEATELYAKALKIRPEWTEGWWASGMIAYERDRYADCRDALARLVKLDTSAAPGFALLGLCEFRIKDYDASFAHLKQAHMMVMQGVGGELKGLADYHLALLLNRQGAFEVSQTVLLSVAPHFKDNRELMIGAGLACLRMPILPEELPPAERDVVSMAGKVLWDLATATPEVVEADFAALLAKYPRHQNVHYLYGSYLAGHRPEVADPEFLEELRLFPDCVPAKVQLALRCLIEQRYPEALKLAKEAVALSPDSVGTQLALAKALRANGDVKAALTAFLEAKRLDPISPEVRQYLVTVYRELGMLDKMRAEQAEHTRLQASQKNWP